MFGEPPLAHPAEMGVVHSTWHPHPWDDRDCNQHDDGADDEEHMVLAVNSGFRGKASLHGGSQLSVHSGTAPSGEDAYADGMQLLSIKAMVAAGWIVAVCVAGVAGNANSLSSWSFLAGIALLPPVVLMWQWNAPVQSMSESIQEARR